MPTLQPAPAMARNAATAELYLLGVGGPTSTAK
jgi:hypothetical protein